jgi:prepilin-type N-terminal cleavage/methylation domain-containing protein
VVLSSLKSKPGRDGFTIIEIIISVIIIAITTLTLAKITKQNSTMVDYVTNRLKNELSNTLFLHPDAFNYDKSTKDAYTILASMKIKNDKTKAYLKTLKRKIYTEDDIPTQKMIIPVTLKAIMLQSSFSTRFYRVEP